MKIITNFEKLLCNNKVKRLLVSLLVGVVTVSFASEYCCATQEQFSKSLIRFHVIANSDSEEDQSLKLKVRDEVAKCLKERLCDVHDIEEAKTVINADVDKIKSISEEVLKSNGCNDVVSVETGVFKFPTKAYESTKLPAGSYYALRVVIGNGCGKNWWCILYPDLCAGIIDEKSQKNVLSDDAYNIVTDSDGTFEYKFKFKILELFGK